jgi:hypothetical protein
MISMIDKGRQQLWLQSIPCHLSNLASNSGAEWATRPFFSRDANYMIPRRLETIAAAAAGATPPLAPTTLPRLDRMTADTAN